MLLLNNGNYYTGITNNITRRMKLHFLGKGSKYVRANKPFKLVYVETALNRSEASKREYLIKKLTKIQKTQLVKSTNNTLDLFVFEGSKDYE